MALVTLSNLTIGFRGPPLLDDVSCQIEPGQRIGLLGRNGSGKTTLMRMLNGQIEPDHGQILIDPRTHVALLSQDVPKKLDGTILELVAQGHASNASGDAEWQATHEVDEILSRMELDPSAEFDSLSSGMKRRVLLAQVLVSKPDLLLLDEPTNHLDIEAITWLEKFLLSMNTTYLFVTHDRMFLRKLATRILEIDSGRLFDWSCDYDTFLLRKAAAAHAEEKQNALFDKKLAQEEVWIRQGIKARRVRNEGRVRSLEKMREQRSQRRSGPGQVKMQIQQAGRSGQLVAEVKDVSFAYDDRQIVSDFSTEIMRGDKVGLIGPNGAGKTTLLRILLGKLKPQQGSVRLGTNLEIAYFDQLREQLEDDRTVEENVADGYDSINVEGKSRHIYGYLQDFLFSPERARTQVRFLSGGERNRVLLARLFSKPANIIVLDEPTNDLDTETLEMLEERLVDFDGTVLLVSHDRAFLNHVVTSSIVFEPTGDGAYLPKEYVGGYDDWLRQRAAPANSNSPAKEAPKKPFAERPKATARRLSYNEQRELKALPAKIETLEAKIEAIHTAMAGPAFFQKPGEKITKEQSRLSELEAELATAYARWETLE